MRFELKAIGPDGAVELIDFQAPDEASAVQSFEGRGYTVLSVRPKRALVWNAGARFPLLLFSQELRALLQAGLPLVEAIDTLAQKERTDAWRALLGGVLAALRQGRPLSAALENPRATTIAIKGATILTATGKTIEDEEEGDDE